MKQIKRRLVDILHKELLIDKALINENARLEKNLAINPSEFNLLLYYFERDTKMHIPDDQISINQNLGELTTTIYKIRKSNHKLQKAS
jgi:acyl carrier protein